MRRPPHETHSDQKRRLFPDLGGFSKRLPCRCACRRSAQCQNLKFKLALFPFFCAEIEAHWVVTMSDHPDKEGSAWFCCRLSAIGAFFNLHGHGLGNVTLIHVIRL